MANKTPKDWTASAVAAAVHASHKTKEQVATESAIATRTFYRKLRGGDPPFNWDELLRISKTLGVHPSSFTPPMFKTPSDHESA